jgi:hypothetical protein
LNIINLQELKEESSQFKNIVEEQKSGFFSQKTN